MRRMCNIKPIDITVGETGYTVRNGTKWADISMAEQLELCHCPNITDHTPVGHGEVVDVWSGKFHDIPARIVSRSHKVAGRSYDGMLEAMKRAYGDAFTEDNFVVAFGYKRLD